jgi:hypothetical protein
MDLALTINGWIDEEVIFAQQLGAQHVFAQVDISQSSLPGWDSQSLARMANRIDKAGLALAGVHLTGAIGRAERRDEALAWAARLAQEAGSAKIPLLSLSGALFTELRPALASLSEAAAYAGVKLAIPLAAMVKERSGGKSEGQALTPESVLDSLPISAGLDGSPELLLDWLQNAAQMSNLRQIVLDRLLLVSYENDRRPGKKLDGCEFDNLMPVCWRLRQAGYLGLIRLGRPSQWKGDSREGHQARAFATGYLRGVLQAFQRA